MKSNKLVLSSLISSLFLMLSLTGCTNENVQNNNQSSNQEESLNPQYLMSFHACDKALKDCTPQEHEIYVAQSDDGDNWEILPNWQKSYGSVPDVIHRGDKLYVFSTGQQGKVITYDLKTEENNDSQHVSIEGLPRGFIDPAPILDLDGNLSLFFIFCRDENEEIQNCFPTTEETDFFVGSAQEVAGSEGEKFTMLDDFQIPVDGGTDPDVFYDGKQYVLYVSHGPSFKVYASKELYGNYTEVSEDNLNNNTGGVPSGYYNAENKEYWTYTHNSSEDGIPVIRRAIHKDLTTPLTEQDWQIVLTGEDLGFTKTTLIESPGFIEF